MRESLEVSASSSLEKSKLAPNIVSPSMVFPLKERRRRTAAKIELPSPQIEVPALGIVQSAFRDCYPLNFQI